MRPYMRPDYPSARVAGTAVTVSCQPGDNLMIHASDRWLSSLGDVLVVTTTAESTDGMFGELLGESVPGARRRGTHHRRRSTRCVGADGNEAFPVWSKAISRAGNRRRQLLDR